ncbi:MAG: SEC-C domain-containing protein, partial [Alphaproteobacteria bacterium]|nr:SEC-C domain-containing protein [Alphaproteobacteria bacterium]
ELLAAMLEKKGVKHQVLNARYHEQEAKIIAEAGVPGAVTIATNMAGRGTDIQLGGNLDMRIQTETEGMPDGAEKDAKIAQIKSEIETAREQVLNAEEVVELEPAKNGRDAKTVTYPGGLFVIGTERHESRRIDNQLRGRSGRQGDPGRSKFYLSLQDDLMRIFGSDRMDSVLKTLGLKRGEAISHSWMNKSLEMAQKKVEARNFDMRKQILKYDDVMNDQRKVIFEQRIDIMGEEDVSQTIADMREEVIQGLVSKHIPENAYAEQWDVEALKEQVATIFNLDLPIPDWAAEEGIADEEIRERISTAATEAYERKVEEIGAATLLGYQSAKGMTEFVASEPALAAFVQDPGANLENIGHHLLEHNSEQIQRNGVDLETARAQAGEIGYQFISDYMGAKSLVEQIENGGDKAPSVVGGARMRDIEKSVLLHILDHLWREHLVTLEHLREVIGFRAFGQRDPLNEYKTEAFVLFEAMLDKLREAVTGQLMHIDPSTEDMYDDDDEGVPTEMIAQHQVPESVFEELAMVDAAIAGESRAYIDAQAEASRAAPVRTRQSASELDPNDPSTWGKVARNAPCPCGSGKKYKHCHGSH